MKKEAILELIRYSVDKLEYRANELYEQKENSRIQIAPKYKISTFCNSDNKEIYKVCISCSIFEASNESDPFSIDVQISGVFHVKKIDEASQLINFNAVAILLPYLRNAVTMLSVLAEQKSIFLPIIDVYSLREELAVNTEN